MDRFYAVFALFFLLGTIVRSGECNQETPIPSWIWSNPNPAENEKVFFRREFQLPQDVVSASITIACDDSQRLIFNGHEIGTLNRWNEARRYDVLAKLNPDGGNIISVEAHNDRGPAALAVHFEATLKDGKILHLISDAQWNCNSEAGDGWLTIPYDGSHWPRALVVAKMGDAPWGNLMSHEKPLEIAKLIEVAPVPSPPVEEQITSPEPPAVPPVEASSDH